jgi:hypothetical protein
MTLGQVYATIAIIKWSMKMNDFEALMASILSEGIAIIESLTDEQIGELNG